jgi:hypothetical protein
MTGKRKVLIIGATGHFGERISRRLARSVDAHILLASRCITRAEKLARKLENEGAAARVSAFVLNQDSESLAEDLRATGAFLVIHTAGPYQGQDYKVAKACIDSGCHYVDLADGREFVVNFAALADAAQQAGVILVSGASTLPALSGAVIEELRPAFASIREIDISIAPGHQTPRGRSTVAAVLSYCGQPIQTLKNGKWATVYGWQDWRWLGYPHMRSRIGGACDVPDLGLLPDLIPNLRSLSFHAALEAPWEQLGLWLMALLTRLRIVKRWGKFTAVFQAISDRLIRLGSDTGAMHLRIRGVDAGGKELTRTWFLTARNNLGPEIPGIPAVIVAKKMLDGRLQEGGARSCYGLITLDEFEQEVSELRFEYDVIDVCAD